MAEGLTLVADSSAWIDLYREAGSKTKDLMLNAIKSHTVLVPDLVLIEVLRGIDSEKTARAVAEEFDNYEVLSVGGKQLALKASANFRHLRSLGQAVRGSIDLLIATWCIENEVPLLHNDRDFDPIEKHLGLQVWRGD